MTDRTTHLAQFIAAAGWQNAARTTVAGDASNRRYDRLAMPAGNTAILMDAPPTRARTCAPLSVSPAFCALRG